MKSTNIFETHSRVTKELRAERIGHKGGVLWLTGLSGAGKSTLATELEHRLFHSGYNVYVLDGDNVRHGLSSNLAFSPEDRAENIRRVGEVCGLFADAGFVTIAAFISPYRDDRTVARQASGDSFHEVFVNADLATCEARDTKGLYKRARQGEIAEFTGISAPYEEPLNAELQVDTMNRTVGSCIDTLEDYVGKKFKL